MIWSTLRDIWGEEAWGPAADRAGRRVSQGRERSRMPWGWAQAQVQGQERSSTLIPFVSSSSKEPMSKASAAFTSPRGGISGGGYCGRTGAGHQHGAGTAEHPAGPGPCCYLLQEDHLPVQGVEEGALLHLLGPAGRYGSSRLGLCLGVGQVAPTNSWFSHSLAL